MERARVADEVRPRITAGHSAKTHVVAQDFDFSAVFNECRQRIVSECRFVVVVQLDVIQFGATDDAFLRLSRKAVPREMIVQLLLHHHVTATGKSSVLLTDNSGRDLFGAGRVSVPSTKPVRSRSSK